MYHPILGSQITAGNRLDEVLALSVFILLEEKEITQNYNMMSVSISHMREDKAG